LFEEPIMSIFSALRELADGLSRGFSLFVTERHNSALDVVARRDSR
jgi:hypothetical protein